MTDHSRTPLLCQGDPAPVQILNAHGASPFVLIGDHAGNAVLASLNSLGLGAEELARHIGWDIGIAGLGRQLSAALDAVFISQAYSRLVIDCNRDPMADDAVPEVSDGTTIPGNAGLDPPDRKARASAIHEPYQSAIGAELLRRDAAGIDAILVSLHSFTPVFKGFVRPWDIGVLHSAGDPAFALATLRLLEQRGNFVVGDNEPYAMDNIDYTVPRHAFASGRNYVEIEVRQDLLASEPGQAEWATTLAEVLTAAAAQA